MMNAQELMETTPATVVANAETADPEFVFPSLQSGAKAASMVATVCADGTRLPFFLVVAGSGGRAPYAVVDDGNGNTHRVPLATYVDEGAEVHHRVNPVVDGAVWEVYAAFFAQHMVGKFPGHWKVLLTDRCKVQASVIALKVLHAVKVVVLMLPSHLSRTLQTLRKDPFLQTKEYARVSLRATLSILPRNSKLNLSNLMNVFKKGAFHGLTSVNIVNSFQKTGTWPVSPSKINVGRLVLGTGARNGARTVDLELLATQLGPGTHRDMRQPQVGFGSVSSLGSALEATAPAVLAAFAELDAEAARQNAAKATLKAAKAAKEAAVLELNARLVADAAARRNSPQFKKHKRSL